MYDIKVNYSKPAIQPVLNFNDFGSRDYIPEKLN